MALRVAQITPLSEVRDVRHTRDAAGAHIISWVNRSCVTGERLARVFDPDENPAASQQAERFFLDLRDAARREGGGR